MSAWEEINDLCSCGDGEKLEAIVFGPWGWGSAPRDGEKWESGFGESDDCPAVPFDKRGKVMEPAEAKPYMQSWSFFGGYGAPECYAIYAWTNKRIIWVTQYDGATGLDFAPRHPADCMPDMPGG